MRNTCLNMVHELAKADPRVVFIGSDLSPGLLAGMQRELPDRFFMEGIAEANVIGMAAGLALEGFIPYVNTIATFITRRCFEQVAVDLCLHDLPVRLIGNGGGLVYAPLGPTHLAIEDMAIMRALPNMGIVAVSDAEEMVRFMRASLDWPHPIYIRLGKGGDPVVSRPEPEFCIGRAIALREAKARNPIALLATGVMSGNALAAAELLAGQGIEASVLHFHTVKPLDTAAALDAARAASLLVTVEEGTLAGGFGSAICDAIIDDFSRTARAPPPILRLGLPDAFPHNYGLQADLWEVYGLLPEQIAGRIAAALEARADAA